ncbi:Eukaryotic translation initiation factor 1A [Spironucleus salmonicida]|uniref:Eukaryotic translation initiation factor 1A n=1 Tax=Spironucleus salmonicida TaxID=348837 RepID=V6LN52_9EUKA|nr:Eukaryotic translation initiation factor 1A [Spironucleus salmonicida]|eukprot:EST45136.1 Eukaryotic translation initiation factor 1A [Spironucleus salmonicida]
MPPTKGGKRQKKHQENETRDMDIARQLALKQEGEEYALILKELGNRMFRAYCFDEKERRIHIPKSIRQRLGAGSLVLVAKREYATEDNEADIVHAYFKEEIKQLQEFGYISDNLEAIMEAKIGTAAIMENLGKKSKKNEVVEDEEQQQEEQVDIDDL